MTEMKNISDKEVIRAFTLFTEYFKRYIINPVFNFVDNEASAAFKMKMTTMDIKYQLVTPSNHRNIQTFTNHFVAGLSRVDKDFRLQFWYILLPQATISLNLIIQSRVIPNLSSYTHICG